MSATPSSFTLPSATLADPRGRVTACHNLRPDSCGSGLIQVGAITGGCMGFAGASMVSGGLITLSDGTACTVIYFRDTLLAVIDGESMEICRVSLPPRCMVQEADGDTILVMPSSGLPRRFRLVTDGDARHWEEQPVRSDLPPLILHRVESALLSTTIPSMTLKGAYTSSSRSLDQTDQATCDAAMRHAYTTLSDRALSSGCFIQPVVARYRLIGHSGEVLYTSAPVIVGASGGFQVSSGSLYMKGDGFRATEAFTLSATSFRIGYSLSDPEDTSWHSLVRNVEILVSPQLHPLSTTLPGSSKALASTSTIITMSLTLPGMNTAPDGAGAGVNTRRAVEAILDNAGTALQPLSDNPPFSDTTSELAALRALLTSKATDDSAGSLSIHSLSAPHGFNASCASRNGDLIAWAGLTPVLFDGYALPEYVTHAVSGASASTPTAVKVTMADGSSVVRTAVARNMALEALSPLIAYPLADAAEISLLSGRDRLKLPLAPTPGGRWAYYLNPSLEALTFDPAQRAEGFAVPSAMPRATAHPSAVAVCSASSPLTPMAVSPGDASTVMGIYPSMSHSSSFTVPSARFFIAGTAGIFSMALPDSRRRINLNVIDRRSVRSPAHVTPVPGGVAAIAGGALVTCTGTRSATLLAKVEGSAVAWEPSRGELWCQLSPDVALILSLDGKVRYTRSIPGVASMLSTQAHMRLLTAGGSLLDPACEDITVEQEAIYQCTVSSSLPPGTTARVHIPLSASSAKGEITLSASHVPRPSSAFAEPPLTSPTPLLILTLDTAGHPMPHHPAPALILPHSHYLTVRLSLTGTHIALL